MWSSRICWSLVNDCTFTVKLAAPTVSALPDPVIAALPVICDVLPTASLGACRKASCSRTRYPATECAATDHVPGISLAANAGDAAVLEDGDVSESGAGAEWLKSTKYTNSTPAAPTATIPAHAVRIQPRALCGRGNPRRESGMVRFTFRV
jgi:hypothetical protein